MNFFEFHIGDYAEATGHLTFIEDAAYMRLLRKCYASERPIPADIVAAQRLVGARTDEERAAVETVLREFFELREDGWHQTRVDSELERFKAGEPERVVKKANEENRLRRHREERAILFRRLTDAGQHAPWNIGIAELRTMVAALPEKPAAPTPEDLERAPATQPETPAAPMTATDETPPATAPATLATATHYPLPTTQYPVGIPSEAKASAAVAAMTVKERVWALGIALLGEQGRAKLGKLVATHGEAVVLEALQAGANEEPGDPYPWLLKTCEKRAKAKPKTAVETMDDIFSNPTPAWAIAAGFPDRFQAENAGCGPGNAHKYREGRRVATA